MGDLHHKLALAREALALGLAVQRDGDIWSIDPMKMKRFKESATEALKETAP